MKIINDTGDYIGYIVTPSGTVISGSKIIASGSVPPNAAFEFTVSGAGIQPIVYVKSVTPQNQGYISRKVATANSVVRIGITEG
jgi:hypothetical protein